MQTKIPNSTRKTFAPKITVNSVVFDRIFGGNTIDIRPQGSAELSFGINISSSENPAIPTRQRTVSTFDFKEKIQMNVIANIGDKMKLTTNYNTEATFDFENKMKIEYTGYEDDIIKKIEAGNITMPLPTTLIQGSQSLFGIKTQLQFGKLNVTGVFSQQKSESKSISVQGGAQTTSFDIKADQYEELRHFFLSQYFKDNYDNNLKDLNRVGSAVNITKIEVWITSRQTISQNNQNRNVFAFADLGEARPDPSQTFVNPSVSGNPLPYDANNDLLPNLNNFLSGSGGVTALRDISNASLLNSATLQVTGFQSNKSYETIENARLLQASEYTLNNRLGYISLNTKLRSNEVLAVSFEYTVNGQVFQVGELTSTSNGNVSGTQALIVKLIHSSNFSPKDYTWDLMMKNIYSLGGFNISKDKFRLNVLYQDDQLGGNINYLSDNCVDIKGIPLLTLFNLDDLNTNNDPQPDGVFDFVNGITINTQNGRIIFPVREPFGSYLRGKFQNCAPNNSDRYCYDALYDSTKTAAQQLPEKNKFSLKGTYQSSSGSDIPLNAVNIPQGSVKVTAGGVTLKENVDYTVDYTLGRVKILNESYLKSNTPLDIKLESNSLFSLQTKTMLGTRLEYNFNKDLQVGGTLMHLYEKPLTQKVNIGDEPVSNTQWGVDGNYRTDSRFMTKLLDKLPFYSTRETSTLTFNAEVAQIIPGHSSAVGSAGTSYVDDFEGAITPLDLRTPSSWSLASIPDGQYDPAMFPEAALVAGDSLAPGKNRAHIAWYYVDPLFQHTQSGVTPSYVDVAMQSNNFVREIPQAEIFPNKSSAYGPQSITCMNVAFYPEERGPYNYDVDATAISKGLNCAGGLKNPESRWGGIMRKIETTDFEANNIEFIQFWMMDPFVDDSPNDGTGGELYFNLGSVSEDVLKDNHKSFENGLPSPSNNYTTSSTVWGVYPNVQSIVSAFDNDPGSRALQDVGLDGLRDETEGTKFQAYIINVANTCPASPALSAAQSDPSTDNYKYFLDNQYSVDQAAPLECYKAWNGVEGNSVSSGSTLTLATNLPDQEDINRDNNMNTTEDYYQYKIEMKPGAFVVGQNYITDEIASTVSYPDGHTGPQVKWYQFKIPVKTPDKTVGSPELNNIEFIRMFMKNFSKPIICRFAKLELLRGEWRRYSFSLLNPGEYSPTPEVPGSTTFDIASVSIEENGARSPVNYVLPPGIEQERDLSAPALATLNEQSLSLKVCELEDGDARGAYRNTQFDFRSYKKLKMFIHAESNENTTQLNDGDMHAFIRIGSDFNDNYYEYEIPLKITAAHATNPYDIWPDGNIMEVVLDNLVSAKLRRNNEMLTNTTVTLLTPYKVSDGDRTITIKGSPNLSNVRSIMVGVRNPKDPNGAGAKICGEVWFNELRLSDFDESGGWASLAKVTAKLADLGTMTVSGRRSTAGWGSIEQKVSERDKFDDASYDVSTSLELGKFLPEKSGIKVPMYFSYSEEKKDPQYNPLDPDVTLTQALAAAPNAAETDKINRTVTDYTQKKSLNFTNVRKTKVKQNAKPHIYDVENLNFTYAYTETFKRDYNTEYDLTKTYSGILGYNYNNNPKPISPFEKSKSKVLGSPWLKFVKDFNFNPMPSMLNFRATLDRTYAETALRNNTDFAFTLQPTYVKTFLMRRDYGLNWDLTKSLKIDLNANATASIDEPIGRIDTREERDSIRENLSRLGRLTSYQQASSATYTVPFSKLPLTDFITGSIRYDSKYNWTAAPLYYDSVQKKLTAENSWGNTISNSQGWQLNASVTFTNLYNKIPYLKKINSPTPPKPVQPKPKVNPENPASKDSLKTKTKTESTFAPIARGIFRTLMMVKTASVNYQISHGTTVPGFRGKPDFLGQDWNFENGPNAPGMGFIFGSQADIRPDAVKYHWLTTDTSLNSFYSTTLLQNLTLRATIEPVKSFKIELTGSRNYTLNHNEYYKYTPSDGQFRGYNPTETGTFSISYFSWNTHFVTDAKDYSNNNFSQFITNLKSFSQILADQNPNPAGTATPAAYAQGYGPAQQEVLTYSFLSAYAGKDPSAKGTKKFQDMIPMPNWRVTYDGLSKLKFFSSFLQSLSISHGYRSVFSVNSFSQNLLYKDINDNGFSSALDTAGNFIPKYDIQQVTISEQLSPLIGIDMTWKNSLQTRFEIKRDRTLTLAYSNIQVTEVRGIEYTIGVGYKFKRVTLPFKMGGKKKLSNDLTVKVDVNLRDNTTILRKVVEGTNQPSAGTRTLGIKVSADYPLNERFNIRAYYDYNANDPFVSSSYPTSNTNAGISVRFTLAQ
ncbi:MAG: cell surface protein SprA [Bacteroidetes bacterium]|nr:cell surface protein SprA [Bacteroidota bacterium]